MYLKGKMVNVREKLGRLKGSNRGVMYAWITIMVSIFVVMLLYITFDDIVQNTLVNLAIELNVDEGVMNNITSAWRAFPVIFIIGLFLYGIIRPQKREYDTGIM